MNFILDINGEPIKAPNDILFYIWFKKANRQIATTKIGISTISTVFLGIGRSQKWFEPILWETLVIGGKLDGEIDRCGGSRIDALNMHEKMKELVIAKEHEKMITKEQGRLKENRRAINLDD
jgi:hypothetical protein